MRIARVYTGDDGRSHFEDIEVATPTETDLGSRSADFPVASLVMMETVASDEMDFHPAPRRQFVIPLSGVMELECGDGTKRQFAPGEIFLADDTTGQGHILRSVTVPRSSIVVPVGEGFELDALRADE